MDEYDLFQIIYKRYFRFVKCLCNGDKDYEQEVWLKLWKAIMRGYLNSVDAAYVNTAIRHSLSMVKRYKRYQPFDAYMETFFKEEWQTTPDVAQIVEMSEWLEGLFARLAPKEAETIKLIAAGYDGVEISHIQKNTKQSVSKTKRRAQRKAKAYSLLN